jgi:hypothetical protein
MPFDARRETPRQANRLAQAQQRDAGRVGGRVERQLGDDAFDGLDAHRRRVDAPHAHDVADRGHGLAEDVESDSEVAHGRRGEGRRALQATHLLRAPGVRDTSTDDSRTDRACPKSDLRR